MDFSKKLKTRLYTAIIYVALGVIMIAGTFATQTDNEFISALGVMLVVMGIVRIRNYFIIVRNEETIRKQEIAETDERNLLILQKAKSTAFTIYLLLAGTAVIVLSFFRIHDAAQWIAYSVLLLMVIHWVCYWVYQKKF